MEKLAVSIKTSTILHVLGVEGGFRAIAQAGIEAVDFSFTRFLRYADIASGQLAGNLFEQDDQTLLSFFQPYKESAEKYGIAFAQAHAPTPSLTARQDVNQRLTNVYARCLQVCAYLSCPYLIVHPFFREDAPRKPLEEEWQDNLAGYGALVPAIRQHGVTVCLENLYLLRDGRALPGPCGDIGEAIRYVDTLNGLAGAPCFSFCLDTGHLLLLGVDVGAAVHGLAGRVGAVHLHDNDGLSDLHDLPYAGTLDWGRLVDALGDIGFSGALNFELYRPFHLCPPEGFGDILARVGKIGRGMREEIAQRQNRARLHSILHNDTL